MEHTFDYTVTLFSPSAFLPTMASADFSQFVVTTADMPPARPHGISPCSFLVCPPDLRTWVTATFWALLLFANLPAIYALYQVSIRRVTISLSLPLACISQCKPWESLSSSSVATPMWTFTTEHGHARHTKKETDRSASSINSYTRIIGSHPLLSGFHLLPSGSRLPLSEPHLLLLPRSSESLRPVLPGRLQ